jgi:hypothetical protein
MQHIALFSLITLCICIAITVFNSQLINSKSLDIPYSKNVLILGDSNSQTAINDSIYNNALNLSSSADPYFYSYLKLKKIVETNTHIDTLVLSFSPHNIYKNNWTFNKEHLYSRFSVYYPFMDYQDLLFLIKGNPKGVISASSDIMKRTLSNSLGRILDSHSIHDYGHFLRLDRNILEDVKAKLKNEEPMPFFDIPKNLIIADSEVHYLYKIIEICKSNNLVLYLANMPKRKELLAYKKYGVNEFYSFYDASLSEIPFLDFSKINLPDNYYGDLVHLNYLGSDYFSTLFKIQGLQNLSEIYSRN